jgi:hypothetical protein
LNSWTLLIMKWKRMMMRRRTEDEFDLVSFDESDDE